MLLSYAFTFGALCMLLVFNGRPNGALTYYLLQALKARDGLTLPLSSLAPTIVSALSRDGYEQIPQLRDPDGVLKAPFLVGKKAAQPA